MNEFDDGFDWDVFDRYVEDCEDYIEFPEKDQPKYKTLSSFKKRKKTIQGTYI